MAHHVLVWVAIVLLILAFLFFIISAVVLEYGTSVSKNGDLIIPWYYWLFFCLAGVCFLVTAILLAIAPYSHNQNIQASAVTEKVISSSFEPKSGKPLYKSELYNLARY